jgi:hypothetical protein
MNCSRPIAVALALMVSMAIPAIAQTTRSKPKPKPAPAQPAKATTPAIPTDPFHPPSVSVTTTYRVGSEATVTTVHSSGPRQRFEFATGRTLIVQCDAKKAIQVSDLAKSYATSDLAAATTRAATDDAQGGPIAFLTTITDTGERREMFGLPARHVTTVTTREPSPAACDKSRTRSETDGWYVDLPVAMHCSGTPAAPPAGVKPECADEAIVDTSGPASALGYPLAYTTTTTDDRGTVVSTISMEATALTTQPVDAAKYDVPSGYTGVPDAGALARAELAVKSEQPKGAGAIRIGVVLPTNDSGAQVEAGAIGHELLDALAAPPYEPVALDATEPTAVEAEAKQKQCDYVLFTVLGTAKTSSPGRIGGLMKKVSQSDTTENHEARVQYRLLAPGNPKPVLEKTATAKSGPGVNVRTVLGVARLAARLYFGLSGGLTRALLSNASGGAGAADPMTNALDMIMTLGAPKQPPAHTLDGIIVTALRTQSADVIKTIGR